MRAAVVAVRERAEALLPGCVEEVEAVGFAADGELLHLLGGLARCKYRSWGGKYLEVYADSGS